MEFDLEHRTASLSIGEFATFAIGPRAPGNGQQGTKRGIWRAQLGTQWHQEMRAQLASERADAEFEVPVSGSVAHGGWVITLTGRIDQVLPVKTRTGPVVLREIKTTLRAIPAAEEELRAEHPDYFAQLAAYVMLRRIGDPDTPVRGELVFVEAGSGLSQTLTCTDTDESLFRARLEAVRGFLDLRAESRERLRGLVFHPPFSELRIGQETTAAELEAAMVLHPSVLFTAPTGFGKTGVLLECALGQMRAGRFSRLIYLTSKATGQLQVMQTLRRMRSAEVCHSAIRNPHSAFVRAWQVRPKREHCVNSTFHCVREACGYLDGMERRWEAAGLSRFYRFENEACEIDALRAAGRTARVCPYEITRVALAFQDVWVGDYNYVFAPNNRGLFFEQPGFEPAETLLVIDEAHNLPSRVADAWSHAAQAGTAHAVLAELDHHHVPAPLVRAWEEWALLLARLRPCEALGLDQEDDVADALRTLASRIQQTPLDYADLGPVASEALWMIPALADWLERTSLEKLLWCPAEGELRFTCLDAAAEIGAAVAEFGGVVFTTATPGPAGIFAESCGLVGLNLSAFQPFSVVARTPWRDAAYDIAYDVRADTTYLQRGRHARTTAATVAALHEAASRGGGGAERLRCVAVFFPSYAYAEMIERELNTAFPAVRVAIQPRLNDLAAQTAWVEESLVMADAVFLVLGSSFAEGIDALGGRVSHAMVVGPALPEVNAVQKARMATLRALSREEAFRRVYQAPGMQKVNQALGRLVRAPGQRARVLLHCRRFVELSYAQLLDRDYQFGETITDDAGLAAWLGQQKYRDDFIIN
ncbi:helicase C-terminal domain-containing protein [Geminisphaera colitermitum]|uniref:helicase C-terminal domain-containing protein n=1 Tax=Geminisphaera colitermitum TaxID=1148786 RepID=UPI000158D27E|nr:helicase C-terminal domain-containing protein [Geminisphaera colitermitum]